MKHSSRPYEFLPHTADMRMQARGRSIKELFQNAARGVSSFLSGTRGAGRQSAQKLTLTAVDAETLLVSWLNELNYLCFKKHSSIARTAISEITPRSVKASITLRAGARIDREIKAFTYHKLAIKRTKNGYKTEIVFDI